MTELGLRFKGSLHKHVHALADSGHLQIAAGQPIEAIPGEYTLNLTEFLLGPNRFALRVQGALMGQLHTYPWAW